MFVLHTTCAACITLLHVLVLSEIGFQLPSGTKRNPYKQFQSLTCFCAFGFADIQDIAVYKSELFCLHTNGKVVHLSLLLVDRCVDRLIRRGFWTLAARVSCLFQNSIISCRVSKYLFVNVQWNSILFPVLLQ